MLKIGTVLWIALTVFLIAFPVCIIAFFISQKAKRYLTIFLHKVTNVAFLKKFKRNIIYRGQQPVNPSSPGEPSVQQESPAEEFVVVEKVEIDVVQNIIEAPMSEIAPEPVQEEIPQDRESFLKNKKLLERIVYEALVLRKE
jgi:hypothetical protein